MAYGTIKADQITYNVSGSDVTKTFETLATPVPEGTAVKSTGESGTTKFLRVDGDGTCSWQVPTDTNTQLSAEQVQDFVGAMVTGNTETGITVTYEDGDGTLDFVVGTLNQDTTGTAAIATEITATANNSTDETVYITFVDGTTGTQGIETDSGLYYNPNSGLLTTGSLTLTGDLTVGGTTTTINTATLDVEDKNLTLGKVSTPTDTTADGGGITLKGATDKTFNWVDATNAWTTSEHIHFGDNEHGLFGASSDLKVYANGSHSYIKHNGDGDLWIEAQGADENIWVRAKDDVYIQTNDNENSAKFIKTGAVELYHNNSKKFETTSSGVTVSGSISDDKGDVRNIPANSQTGAYTLVVGDAGKVVANTTGGWTLPASVFTTVGQTVTLLNNSGSSQNITASALTYLYNTSDGANIKASTIALGARGIATIWFDGGATGYIQSAALTVS